LERKEVSLTDNEFNVLDELYFVRSYDDLKASVDLNDKELVMTLQELHQKSWLKVLESVDEEITGKKLWGDYKTFYFLASKNGLMAHNTTI